MLEVKNISVTLNGNKLVDSLSFNVSPGKLVALVGPNGAGKSTLLKVLSGDLPYDGEVTMHQTNIKNFTAIEMAQIKAVMTQKSSVNFDFLVKEITMMGRYPHFAHVPSDTDEAIVNQCHQTVGLSNYSDRIHSSLSGGEQQRNHFSRALAQLESNCLLAKLLLLDEPLNNLDIKYQFKLMELVKDFVKKGNSTIVVLHDLNIAAAFADEMIFLKKGRIVQLGEVETVFTPENLSDCYDMEAVVQPHPIAHHPMVFFSATSKEDPSFMHSTSLVNG